MIGEDGTRPDGAPPGRLGLRFRPSESDLAIANTRVLDLADERVVVVVPHGDDSIRFHQLAVGPIAAQASDSEFTELLRSSLNAAEVRDLISADGAIAR